MNMAIWCDSLVFASSGRATRESHLYGLVVVASPERCSFLARPLDDGISCDLAINKWIIAMVGHCYLSLLFPNCRPPHLSDNGNVEL
jgi:hypothetical protein